MGIGSLKQGWQGQIDLSGPYTVISLVEPVLRCLVTYVSIIVLI